MDPLISVIVLVYNAEKYLPRCINSILSQTYTNIEVILVDDGSPDNSPQICDDYAQKDKRVRVIHQQNGGICVASNVGLAAAKGDYISFVDNDDYIDANTLEVSLSRMQEQNADIIVFEYAKDYGNRIERIKLDEKFISDTKVLYDGVLWDSLPSYVWLFLAKRSMWEGITFPEKVDFEDFVVMIDVYHNAKNIILIRECFYYYNCVNVNSITKRTSSRHKLGMFLGWEKRLKYALECNDKKLWERAVARCVTRSVTTLGLNTYDHLLLPEYEKRLYEYIASLTDKELALVGLKHKVLVWAAGNCQAILKLYGNIVYGMQKIKHSLK